MDVSVQLAAGTPAAASDGFASGRLDALNGGLQQKTQPAGVMRFNEAFQRAPVAAPSFNVVGVIDRLRSDFETFRLRMDASRDSKLVNAKADTAASQLTQAMDVAMRAQVDIFDMSVAFHAGLSASQQSQNGVKTLIEKS